MSLSYLMFTISLSPPPNATSVVASLSMLHAVGIGSLLSATIHELATYPSPISRDMG